MTLPLPLLLQVVAQLTADNLMLLMQLRKAEAELEAGHQERSQLRLAVERQKGPWFAEVGTAAATAAAAIAAAGHAAAWSWICGAGEHTLKHPAYTLRAPGYPARFGQIRPPGREHSGVS